MLLKVESFFCLSSKIVKLSCVHSIIIIRQAPTLLRIELRSLKVLLMSSISGWLAHAHLCHVSSVVSSRWAEWLSWVEATSRIQDTLEAPKDESQSKLWKSHSYLSGILETILFHLGLEIIKQGNYKLLHSLPFLQAKFYFLNFLRMLLSGDLFCSADAQKLPRCRAHLLQPQKLSESFRHIAVGVNIPLTLQQNLRHLHRQYPFAVITWKARHRDFTSCCWERARLGAPRPSPRATEQQWKDKRAAAAHCGFHQTGSRIR